MSRGGEVQENIGCIEIRDNVFIGSGTIILGNVRIGPNAIVAAGSLVNKDVPPNTVVGGVPVTVIGDFNNFVKRREVQLYPNELKPFDQEVSDKMVQFMWKRF